MELENIILSEVSQAQKVKNHIFALICGLQTYNKCNNIMGHTGGIREAKDQKLECG
jgi:hypothetical protein